MQPPPGNPAILRDVTGADLPVFFKHQSDAIATTMAAMPSRDHGAFVEHWTTILADPGVLTKCIVLDGVVAGYLVSFARSGHRLVGYWIGREHWGRGIATRALAEFVAQDHHRPLRALVAKHNVASARVLEKCGFLLTGRDVIPAMEGQKAIEELIYELSE